MEADTIGNGVETGVADGPGVGLAEVAAGVGVAAPAAWVGVAVAPGADEAGDVPPPGAVELDAGSVPVEPPPLHPASAAIVANDTSRNGCANTRHSLGFEFIMTNLIGGTRVAAGIAKTLSIKAIRCDDELSMRALACISLKPICDRAHRDSFA